MRIALGTDEETVMTAGLVARLGADGHQVTVVAPGQEWPEVGRGVALEVVSGRAEVGVVCCTTGTGVAMAANKVPGARAALCGDAATAAGARRWNDANVLALSLALTSAALAEEVVAAFVGTGFDPAEQTAVDRLEAQ